jgi:uncharacterized protein
VVRTGRGVAPDTMSHGGERNRAIAEGGLILRCLVGSGIHGISVKDQDDRDEMGITVEPPEYVIGLGKFEQYQFRTQPEGHRSGPGDLDLTIYSLRKYVRLALQGNPSIITLLFTPEEHVLEATDLGYELLRQRDMFLSRQAGHRFLGYLNAQKERMLDIRGGRHTNRPELIEKYGFDTKYAAHAIRLGVQGVELLQDGDINLPMVDSWRTWLTQLRVGAYSKEVALAQIEVLENQLQALLDTSELPEHPDYDRANRWLIMAYQEMWSTPWASRT